MYYYNARYYDPEIGRFTREDDYQGDNLRPQTFNLYVYTLNNPIKFIDPSGNDAVGPINANELIREYLPENENLDIEEKPGLFARLKDWWNNYNENYALVNTLNGQAYMPKEVLKDLEYENSALPLEFIAIKKGYMETNWSETTIGWEAALSGNFFVHYVEGGVGVHVELDILEDLKTAEGRAKIKEDGYFSNYFTDKFYVSRHFAGGYSIYPVPLMDLKMNPKSLLKDFRAFGVSFTTGPTFTYNTPSGEDIAGLSELWGVNLAGWGVNYSKSGDGPNSPTAIQIFGGIGIQYDVHRAAAEYTVGSFGDIYNFIFNKGDVKNGDTN